ncbi:MAG: Bifunctional PGK/TIM [Chlamydiae bacterium]|nr:Bifunctional PGK/TIM [Chlamydiota bacterium]
MDKLFIEDLPISGKKVLMRVDFNVPLDPDLNVVDPTRIKAVLPSINYILDKGGSLILMSHLGRPKGAPTPEYSLAPCAKVLSALLNRPVQMAPDCIGHHVADLVSKLKPGDILLLENLRFHLAETHPKEDPEFAKELASFGDFFVNDAFGTAHRKHSSTFTITEHFPGKAAAGYLLEKEIQFIGKALTEPKRPFYAMIGGAKISTKIGVLKSLLKKVDRLIVGGGMAFTFFKAKKIAIGNSLCEEDLVPIAEELLAEFGEKILLPVDCVIATEMSEDAPTKIIDIADGIQDGYQGLDIGPKSIRLFQDALKDVATILWNGPFGVYEIEAFAKGTNAMAQTVASSKATTIVGGGDIIAALNAAELSDKISHISTGGGATLEYIEFGTLPCIEALSDKAQIKT